MRIIEGPASIQGSPEWLQFRSTKISATAAGAISGFDPWKSPEDIYDLMLGIIPPEPSNSAMKRGNELEPIARDLAIKKIGLEFKPIVVQHTEYDWAMASLDGFSFADNSVLEIKCPSKPRIHEEHLQGIIKPSYIAQIMWQIYCTESRGCYFCSYFPRHETELIVHEIPPDKKYIKLLEEKCKDFYFNNYLTLTRPGWVFKNGTC